MHLFLRERKIQAENSTVRCIPTFNFEKPLADILFLIASPVRRKFFEIFEKLLHDVIKVDYRIWDIQIYENLCYYEDKGEKKIAPWVSKYKNRLIILIADDKKSISSLDHKVLYDHFYSHNNTILNSGLLCIHASDSHSFFISHLFDRPINDENREDIFFKSEKISDEEFSDWFSVSSISKLMMEQKIKQLELNERSNHPLHISKIYVNEFKPFLLQKGKSIFWQLWCYGNAEKRTLLFSYLCNARAFPISDCNSSNLLKIIIESSPIDFTLSLLNSEIQPRFESFISNFPAWIRSLLFSQIITEYKITENWSHVEKIVHLLTDESSVLHDSIIFTEFLCILYRIHGELSPSWLSFRKKQTAAKLAPLKNCISQLEPLIVSFDANDIHKKSQTCIAKWRPTSKCIWSE